LIALVADRPGWAVGYEDETWWSRVAQPGLSAWAAEPLRLVAASAPKGEPKALACYGVLLPALGPAGAATEEVWLRFVDGRPVSAVTIQFLAWCADRLAAAGVATWVLVWDNAAWHLSQETRGWLRAHNRRAHREGGVRIVPCPLPIKSPWLNPIEPKWVHAKRRVAEPARLLSARELEERVCTAFACPVHGHLAIPQQVA
jgi:transposase